MHRQVRTDFKIFVFLRTPVAAALARSLNSGYYQATIYAVNLPTTAKDDSHQLRY